MNKITYSELCSAFRARESANQCLPYHEHKHLSGCIVFTEDSFNKPYSLEARTYAVTSDNKAYQPNMGGYSIYGSAIDGSDPLIRLERYMAAEKGGKDGWKVDYCYLTGGNGKEAWTVKVKDLIEQEISIDVCDDVVEELYIAFDGPQPLTEQGAAHFAEVLEYTVVLHDNGYDTMGIVNVDDGTENGWKRRLRKAKEFFEAAAGYCADSDYHKWFKEV